MHDVELERAESARVKEGDLSNVGTKIKAVRGELASPCSNLNLLWWQRESRSHVPILRIGPVS